MQSFPHEMLREIYEQPDALSRTFGAYLENGGLKPKVTRLLAGWAHPAGEILIAASGSSRHSGLAGEILLEDLCGFAVDVEYSSEYSVRGGSDLRRPAVIVISQSGETSDTLAALREVRLRGQATLAITNAASSTMAREAQVSMPLSAGIEKAIPATKSFTCQLAVLFLLGLYEGSRLGQMDAAALAANISSCSHCPPPSKRNWTAGGLRWPLLPSKCVGQQLSLPRTRNPLRDRARGCAEDEGIVVCAGRGLPDGRAEARAECAGQRSRAPRCVGDGGPGT